MILTLLALAELPSTGPGALPLLGVWVGAIVAAFGVALHQATALIRLRREVDALEQRATPGAAGAGDSPQPRRETTPIFGGLYAAEPSVLDRVRDHPALSVGLVAMVLAVLSGALLVRNAEEVRALAVAQRVELKAVRATQDSLSRLVARLRDTLTSPGRPGPVSQAARPPVRRPAGSRVPPRREPIAAGPALPPPPRIDAATPTAP